MSSLGDWREAYLAGRDQAVWFDLSQRDELTLTGSDRQAFLHGFCTNDIRNLSPGQSCEAFITNIKGKVLAHAFIFAEEDRLVLDGTPGSNTVLLPHLDRYLITEDVQLRDTTADRTLLYVTGPTAHTGISRLDREWGELAVGSHTVSHRPEGIATIRKVDWLGVPGYQFTVSPTLVDSLKQGLQQAGIPSGSPPAWEALRVQAGFPLHGIDFSEDNLAQEVERTTQAISFRKGCYLGQEPIARIDALGHVNWMLRRWELSPEGVAAVWDGLGESPQLQGAELVSAPGEEKPIGKVTSFVWLPESAGLRGVGLALMRREFSQVGQEIQLRWSDQHASAQVT